DKPPWSIEGLDVQLATHVTGGTGATEIDAKIYDRKGTLTAFDAHSPSLPYHDWLHGRSLTPERLGALRVAGRLVVPRRDLKTFPALLKTQQFSGSVGASAE